jgi:hypothetical protein
MIPNREHIINVLLARLRTHTALEAKPIDVDALKADDAIILLMGPPYSGKSTFLDVVAGSELVPRRKPSENPATSISAFRLSVPDFPGSVVLVNTPAFNDTGRRDLDILSVLSDGLNQTYKRGILVSGLIYFHRISDAQMEGTALRNWCAFEKICGDFKNVVIATTMWGDVSDRVGEKRTEDLFDFCRVGARGWFIQPFRRDHLTAAGILTPIFEHTAPRQPLQLQKEISDNRLSLKQTAAARALFVEIEKHSLHIDRKIQQILLSMLNADEARLIDLEKEFRELADLHGRLLARKDELKPEERGSIQRRIPIFARFLHLFIRISPPAQGAAV